MDLRMLISFLVVVVLIGICSAIILGAINMAEERLRETIETEAKLIHRRIDDLTGEMQIMGDAFTKWLEHQKKISIPPGNVKIEAVRKVPPYDYESSMRATLEEFKEKD